MYTNEQMLESESKKEKNKKLVGKYNEVFDRLSSDRTNFESHWQECMDNIIPRKGDITSTRLQGDKRNSELFDSTAINANQLLAAALHGMLTNPATRFFELVINDPVMHEDEDVKQWLQEVGDRMYIVMNNSNFQTEIHEVYIDIGAIGTAAIYMGEHEENVVHFNARSMKEIYVQENNLGLIDTVYRKFEITPRQMVQEFGEDNLDESIIKKYREGDDGKMCAIHAVHPMDDYQIKDSPSKWKFKSCYYLKDDGIILSESGYREFPYAVPRWTKTSGEVYGRGPGMDMLPDIKMLNRMMETTLKGAQKTVDPPLMVSDDGVIGRVRLMPGGITVVRPMSEVPIRPLITDSRVDFGIQMIEGIRQQIRAGFFVDQLQLNQGPQMTAAEVYQRTEEKLRLMGPVLGRQHFEFLRPVIERVFGIMVRRGLLPPAPSVIQGQKFDVQYSSLIARAQRVSEGQQFGRAIAAVAPIVNAQPETLDNLDGDAAIKYLFELNGMPQKLLRKNKAVGELRAKRAEAQQMQMQQQQQQHEADVAGKALPGIAQFQQAQTNAKEAQ